MGEGFKLKVGIISPGYSSKNRYSFAFIHARVKLYIKNGVDVKAFVISKEDSEYSFENVPVSKHPSIELVKSIEEFNPDVLAIHYPLYNIISLVKDIQLPKIVWIHGHEILWSFRLRSSKSKLDYIKKRFVVIPREIYKIYSIRKFLPQVEYSVFVSKWMHRIAEKHSMKKYKNSIIIPNPVDTELFNYEIPKTITRAISLRSFDNSKYGLDIAIRAYSNLSKTKLYLFGKGRFKNKFIQLAKKINSNTKIIEKSIEHSNIPDLYHRYSFFIAPSRVEAQGLAMCEAMACGLPVIATNVGGIPEFVRDGIDGFLVPPNDPKSMRDAIVKLISNENKFLEMSINAHENITNKCSGKLVVEKEIRVLKKAIKKYYES